MEMILADRKVEVINLIINRKRIQNPKRYLYEFGENEEIRVAVKVDDTTKEIMKDVGFCNELISGECVLPSVTLSKAAFENSEGKCVVRRDLPMERAERYWEWSWNDWGGNSHTDSTYIPYFRYVREYFEPKAFEMSVGIDAEGAFWIASDPITTGANNHDDIKLLVNLFLSIFKSCEIVSANLSTPIPYSKRLDWEILRPGKSGKSDIGKSIDRIIDNNVPIAKRSMFKRNIESLRQKNPDVIAVGKNGFNGYIVFNYPKLKIAVLESLMPNNATYILNENWEEVSKLTKTQVLSNSLHKDRIYHYQNWEKQIEKHLIVDSQSA